jgi:RND family efflux transporter MFP subunit
MVEWSSFGRRRKLAIRAAAYAIALLGLAACQDRDRLPDKKPVPVRTAIAQRADHNAIVVLSGEIRAQYQSDLSFRVSGRIAERKAEIGDHVAPDQVLATIDPQEQQQGLRAAEATVQAAEAQLRQAASAFDRQKALLERGYTTRRESDQAEQAYRTAQSSLDSANAQLATARDQLSYTVLRAGNPGVITARNAEAGQVVQAAQAVFSLAQDGGRDAVFNVYESVFAQELADGKVEVALIRDPSVRVTGRVREVSPTVDPTMGTVRVKIGLPACPPAMALGAAVTGTARLKAQPAITLPAGALSSVAGKPAVWIVDPATKAVSAQPVTIGGYGTGQILVEGGLAPGAIVVTAGAQFLTAGQIVAPTEEVAR